MKIISILSSKNFFFDSYSISEAFSYLNKKVLFIDFKPKAIDISEKNSSDLIFSLETLISLIDQTEIENLSVINFHNLFFSFEFYFENNFYILKNIFNDIFFQKYDYIIIDCQDPFNSIISNSLIASDILLFAIEADFNSFFSLKEFFKKLQLLEGNNQKKFDFKGFFIKNYNFDYKKSNSIIEKFKNSFQKNFFDTILPLDNFSLSLELNEERKLINFQNEFFINYLKLSNEILKKINNENI